MRGFRPIGLRTRHLDSSNLFTTGLVSATPQPRRAGDRQQYPLQQCQHNSSHVSYGLLCKPGITGFQAQQASLLRSKYPPKSPPSAPITQLPSKMPRRTSDAFKGRAADLRDVSDELRQLLDEPEKTQLSATHKLAGSLILLLEGLNPKLDPGESRRAMSESAWTSPLNDWRR